MTEADWKRFRKLVPTLRERHLEKVNSLLMRSLSQPNKTPTELFWEAEEIIGKEVAILRICFDGHCRSQLNTFMFLMLRHGILAAQDLEGFSPELRTHLERIMELEHNR